MPRHTPNPVGVHPDMSQVVGYIRVSTDEQGQSGLGLAAQRTAIDKEVLHRGWTLVEMCTDVASGKSRARRPELERAIGMVNSGQAGTLMVAKLDRLSRSILDFAAIMDEALRGGWNVVALDLGVDLSTPAGEAMANVMATFAQFERRLIGERTVAALRAKREEGVRLGRPLTISEEIAQLIRDARESGQSYLQIAQALNTDAVPTGQGGAKWYPSTVRAIEKREGSHE
jgi:DNA invertase Pin-like site-specific DNA recombinase